MHHAFQIRGKLNLAAKHVGTSIGSPCQACVSVQKKNVSHIQLHVVCSNVNSSLGICWRAHVLEQQLSTCSCPDLFQTDAYCAEVRVAGSSTGRQTAALKSLPAKHMSLSSSSTAGPSRELQTDACCAQLYVVCSSTGRTTAA